MAYYVLKEADIAHFNTSVFSLIVNARQMYLLIFLIFIVQTQESLYSILGVSGPAVFILRALADLCSVSLFVFHVLKKTAAKVPIHLSGSGYETYLAFFVFYSIGLSLAVGASNLVTNFSEILVLNRFAFLAMVIPFVVNTEHKLATILQVIWVSILIQAGLGLLQSIGGPGVVQLFAPSDYTNILSGNERSFTSNRDLDRGFVIGSLGDFISFGYMMIFGLVFHISNPKVSRGSALVIAFFVLMTYLSGSRMIFLTALMIAAFHFFKSKDIFSRVLWACVLIPVLLLLLILLSNMAMESEFSYTSFLSIFSPRFIEVLMNQRLGLLVVYLPELFKDSVILTGLSPDKWYVVEYANENFPDLPYVLLANLFLMEDSYVVALLSYYGLIGSVFFYLMWYRIIVSARGNLYSADIVVRRLAVLVLYSVVGMNLLSFANQSFENRGGAFILWVVIGVYFSALKIRKRAYRESPPI